MFQQQLTTEEKSMLARRVLHDDVFYNYPSWFHEIDVSPGPMSDYIGLKAWMILNSASRQVSKYMIVADKLDKKIDENEIGVRDIPKDLAINNLEQERAEEIIETITYNIVTKNFDMLELHGEQVKEVNEPLVDMLRQTDLNNYMSDVDVSLRYKLMDNVGENYSQLDKFKDIKVEVPQYDNIETEKDFSSIISKDEEFLRSVKGMRKMTNNFVIGRVSTRTMYIITEFLDIRQVMLDYQLRIIIVEGVRLKPYLVDILIRNGYFLIDESSRIKKQLTNKDVREGNYGVYSINKSDHPVALYYNMQFYKRNLEVPDLEMLGQQNQSVACVFTRVHLMTNINLNTYGILPSSCPDHGQTICVYPPMKPSQRAVMLQRVRNFMLCRYRYMNDRQLWATIDIYRKECGYDYKFVLPKRVRKMGETYSRYKGLQDFTMERRGQPMNLTYMISHLEDRIMGSMNKESLIINMIQNWNNPRDAAWIRIFSHNNIKVEVVLDELKRINSYMKNLIEVCQQQVKDAILYSQQEEIRDLNNFRNRQEQRNFRGGQGKSRARKKIR